METLNSLPVIAGMISSLIFASGTLPMLYKALRTRDLRSYSLVNIAMSNLGNLVHWIYIASLPVGPIWLLHTFYTVSTAIMLVCYLSQRSRPLQPVPA